MSSPPGKWWRYHLLSFYEIWYFRMSDQVKDWYRLGKQRDKESWEMYPSQVNAYYNPPANEVCDLDAAMARLRIDHRI